MKIIFSCYYGCFTSVVAANIYLGTKDMDKTRDLLELEDFGLVDMNKVGNLKLQGVDGRGSQVYTMRGKKSVNILKRAVVGFSKLYDIGPIQLVDLNGFNNLFTCLGMFISRHISHNLGNRIVAWDINNRNINLKRYIEKRLVKVLG